MKRLTIVFILSVVFFFWNLPTVIAQFSEAGVQEFKLPIEAPDFTLKELGGGTISLRELRGKIIVINFFAVG